MAKNLDTQLRDYIRNKAKITFYRKSLERAIGSANKAGLKQFAEEVAELAKEKVPVKTGRLRDSIKGSVRKRRGGKPGEFQASITTNTEGMAKHYEFVTEKYGQMTRKRLKEHHLYTQEYGYGMDVEIGRARDKRPYTSTPYLRPAFEQKILNIPEILQRVATQEAVKQQRKAMSGRDMHGRFLKK